MSLIASLAEATNEMVDREAEWEMLASQQREDSRNKIERVVSEAASKEQETSQRLCRSLADLEVIHRFGSFALLNLVSI